MEHLKNELHNPRCGAIHFVEFCRKLGRHRIRGLVCGYEKRIEVTLINGETETGAGRVIFMRFWLDIAPENLLSSREFVRLTVQRKITSSSSFHCEQ